MKLIGTSRGVGPREYGTPSAECPLRAAPPRPSVPRMTGSPTARLLREAPWSAARIAALDSPSPGWFEPDPKRRCSPHSKALRTMPRLFLVHTFDRNRGLTLRRCGSVIETHGRRIIDRPTEDRIGARRAWSPARGYGEGGRHECSSFHAGNVLVRLGGPGGRDDV